MILHIERKFIAPTETFIANQINFQTKYKSIVYTASYLNNLNVNAEVFSPGFRSLLQTKILSQKNVKEFMQHYSMRKPRLLHGHFLTDAAFFHPFTKHLDIPKICSGYGYDVSSFPAKFFGLGKIFFKKIFKEYDTFLAMSNDMANDFVKLGCPEKKIIVHYYGTDTHFFDIERHYRRNEDFTILTIASLVPKKGHISVLQALSHLRTEHPEINFKYNIIGKGPLLQDLEKFVLNNNLQHNVHFYGLIKHGDDLLDILKKADVFIHPSVTDKSGNKEGIPGTIVEAMASGLPVIATYHAGIPEIITNNYDGLLIREKDVSAIKSLIFKLYSEPELRIKIGSNAKNTAVNKLDIRLKTRELEEIYHKFL